jgi:hypothetical protein
LHGPDAIPFGIAKEDEVTHRRDEGLRDQDLTAVRDLGGGDCVHVADTDGALVPRHAFTGHELATLLQ